MRRLFTTLVLLGVCFIANPGVAGQTSKITLCHIPPGNPENPQTITVHAKAVEAHLAHGDLLGECLSGCSLDINVCDDNDPCTDDQCLPDGTCQSSPVDCDDGNACTLDSCDSYSGGCVYVAQNDGTPCDDSNICTGPQDVCLNGECRGEPVVGCCLQDGDCSPNACNNATCDEHSGECTDSPVICPPAPACFMAFCDPVDGCQEAPIDCDDSDFCTDDFCDPDLGDCVNEPTSSPPEVAETSCVDGLDNDCDGSVDQADSDCAAEICDDGVDNDQDGFTDCDDFDCHQAVVCDSEICDDGVDNDGDGFVDCEDLGCIFAGVCPDTEVTDATCSDGVDNDQDGFTDCDDFDCGLSPLTTICK